MSDEKEEVPNPAAFPCLGDVRHNPEFETDWGMSLRDYYAGECLTGYLSSDEHGDFGGHKTAKSLANSCFEIADAMLKERIK